MVTCGNGSNWARAAMVLVLLGLCLHIADYATNYWEQLETERHLTIMVTCGNGSNWARAAMVLVLVGLCLHIAGYTTNYWEQLETERESMVLGIGLWKAENCSGGHDAACKIIDIPSTYTDGSIDGTRAFETLVLLILLVTAVLIVLYVFTDKCRLWSVGIALIILCFVTVACGILGIIIWVAQLPSHFFPSYSFGLSVFGLLLVFLAGILLMPDIRQFNQTKTNKPDTVRVLPSDRPKKYDSYERNDYRSYNRKFRTPEPETEIRHYYNPNRKASYDRGIPMQKFKQNYARSDVQTPDILLGDGARYPRRY